MKAESEPKDRRTATPEQELLERMVAVQERSRNLLPFRQRVEDRFLEMDYLHSLYFNTAAPGGPAGAFFKKALQKFTRPLLYKQVQFNAATRDLLLQTSLAIADLEEHVQRMEAKISCAEEQSSAIERITEKPFVMQSLGRLYGTGDAEILNIGPDDSMLSAELTSLGHSVTALTAPLSGLSRPALEESRFDCAVAPSVLASIGLGWFGDKSGANLDLLAVEHVHRLLKPGGHLIFTVPYGRKALTPLHRIYDRVALQELVGPFGVEYITYAVRLDDCTVVSAADESKAADKEYDPETYAPGALAMVVCNRK